MRHKVTLKINGKDHGLELDSRLLLVDALRQLGFTSVHNGCDLGQCGACTVLLDGRGARSCLTFAVQCEGMAIETVEALNDEAAAAGLDLHPLQRAFHEHHALQCGFCTPAMLLSARELLARDPHPDEEAVRTGLAGNLCRCTGYVNIVRAVLAVADEAAEVTSDQGAP